MFAEQTLYIACNKNLIRMGLFGAAHRRKEGDKNQKDLVLRSKCRNSILSMTEVITLSTSQRFDQKADFF